MITDPAREMIQSGINGYFVQSVFNDYFILGCVIGFFLGIELLILLDIASGIMRKNAYFDCKDEKTEVKRLGKKI